MEQNERTRSENTQHGKENSFQLQQTWETSGFLSSLSLIINANVIKMTEIKPRHAINTMHGGRVTVKPIKLSSGDINAADGVRWTIFN
jgi:hypothetical protein